MMGQDEPWKSYYKPKTNEDYEDYHHSDSF